ncbi:SusC/RagA family TonB-linked outer membrane protein [Flavobacterium sp. LS1P28]|uniref:SusC/RagA family TonB-linked outer membrane protein n=1 Tax=Flavobacterium sp. LS1P28 TaxID=2497752 RepID=UPI000F81DEED|nr:SusC/RagA family TonB-linked outer membrane protein [Flavobacterium sp. LS1P28]RTY78844.1 SusC/RagA family TonB-linked outer membrane protein [Flavobacterium sp. LS1P28]
MKIILLNKGLGALWYSLIFSIYLFSFPILANNMLGHKQFMRQQIQISGTVTDGTNPLSGVTIAVKGQQKIVVSDLDGKFTITVSPNDILIFTYMGFKTLTIPVDGRTVINIKMQEDATALQEVRVNAGYYSVKDSERTGSIAKIKAADIEKQPVTNFLATMQGRLAGVSITQTTGVPGGGFNIQIRGQNSLRAGGNAPLYIIDGVPYSSEAIGIGISSTIMPANTSPLNNINPGDIESIEILKDADATAIYGSRGANGVVLVSTKKGKAGKTRFSATLSQGTGKVAHFMDMMNTQEYLTMRTEAFKNDGIVEFPENAYDINGAWDQNRYTNWQKKLLGGTAKITNINASVSGGSELTQFLISSNYGKETTVFPGDFAYTKANLHLNLNHDSEDKKFRITFSAGYTIQDNKQPSTDLSAEAWLLPPNAPALYDQDGNLNWENNTFENPLRNLSGLSKVKTYDLIGNTLLSYSILKNLEIKTSLGYTDLNHWESSTFPSTIYNPAYGLGSESSSIFYNTTARQSWIIEPQLNWKKEFGSFKTDLLLGSTFQRQNNKLQALYGYGFTSNSMIYNPAAATDLQVMQYDESVYKYQSFFGRANLNWNDRYIVNLTGRRDGSSRFGPNNSFAWFGAVGAAWIFSRETFINNNDSFLSFGKIRASYGTTGNDQIGNYQFLNTYTPASTFYQNAIGLQPTRLYNPNFGWETNKKLETAIETGFFKDRVFLTAAWYKNRSSNQLVGIPLPGTTGFAEIQSNLDAIVENSGIEVTLRTMNYQRKDFSFSTNINFTVAKNKLVSFPNLEGSTYSTKYVIGQPLNIVKVFHYTGLDPQTGIYTFQDVNGDGIISEPEDKTFVKDLNPAYFGGVQNHLKYKNWQLDFLFQFVKQENYNTPRMLALPGTMANQASLTLNHWQQPGDSGPAQMYSSGTNGDALNALYQYAASDAVIVNASYVRLKNVSFSYDFPKNWLKNMNCRATIEGQNLLTITPYKGSDPEFIGIGTLPPLRIITAGLKFNF